MNKIVIIDGNSLLFRAFYATSFGDGPLLSTSYGTPTNAVVAFSNMLANIMKTLNPDDGIFVAFDKGKHTFRHQEYELYKANRKSTPQELLVQMPIARELLKTLNIAYYEADDIEADDIAGIMAKRASKQGYKVEIYTSDHDYLQLIDDNITIELIKKGLTNIAVMTPDSFKEEYGIEPIQITDLKGLLGDSSDNLPGIPKVGEKTALNLIKTYGDLEAIISAASEMKSKVGESIIEHQDLGRMCKRLATINTTENILFTVEETIYHGYKFEDVSDFMAKYEMKKLSSRLPKNLLIEDEASKEITIEEITTTESLDLSNGYGISVDSDNGNYHNIDFYGFSISVKGKTYYITKENALHDLKFIESLKNKEINKYCFNFKKIKCILNHNKIDIDGLYFDLMLATYLLNSSLPNDFASMMEYYRINVQDALVEDNSLFTQGNKKLASYIAHFSYGLYDNVVFKLKEKDQYNLLIEIEQPLTIILADMEIEGFPIDKETLLSFKDKYLAKIDELQKTIYEYAGEEFNISSTKQLAHILFEKMMLKPYKKGSTSYEVLRDIRNQHPIIDAVLEYRKYTKQVSTYIDGIVPFIGDDDKLHATFNQTTTTTGRLSSSEPNLQNISVRDEENKMIRKAFHYKDENLYLMSLDYSQIELRMLAHLSNSESLISIFKSGNDIHSETAKKVFHLDGEPNSQQRRQAKAVNFGIIYGISDFGLAEQIETSFNEAREIISNFYEAFPDIKLYMDGLVDFAKTHGYATTMFNRRRYLDELNDPSYQVREFAKRASMNAPIQGSAADLIKIAMINVYKKLKEGNYKSCLISQIHDELILKVYDDEKDEVYNLVKETMENCVKLKVELKVDGGYAKDWYEAK